ncbi:hypothetical protein BDY21DRAFT_353074 [Lineolata rhizophorae]|uniref:Cyclase-domain-containing protein n=1 Tax=Lineolata rhizophorae TaxID=578093 RepID=A0A6A6NRZ1_9PEZI|nr:hypothetical protein BDY21DRAFT_353074 [Lineolata rhizophorae]
MTDPLVLPDFDNLPPVNGMPLGCAWGLFDKDGKKDIYGTLNLLTPSVVRAAAGEVQEGVSVSLDWPLGAIKRPGFGRTPFSHKITSFEEGPAKCYGFDDAVEFDTQVSSQWDSLCHFNHQPTGLAYNGIKPTKAELVQSFGNEDKEGRMPTLNHWLKRGGVVGRGVLLDYKAYADAKGIVFDPFDNHRITVRDLEDVAAFQGTELKLGDILLFRTGFTEHLEAMSGEEQAAALDNWRACGIDGSEEMARWLWNKHFSAVTGDAYSLEQIPPIIDGEEKTVAHLVLHPYLLSLFGMPIGELWDLKALSEQCAKSKRWSFMLTSAPLNIAGGVGSPPNALAIF